MSAPISPPETDTFNEILNGPGIALMRGHIDDEPAALIVQIHRSPTSDYLIQPLGMLFREEDLFRLTDSNGTPLPTG